MNEHDAEDAWAADMLYGAEPSAAPPTQTLAVDAEIADGTSESSPHAVSSGDTDETVALDDPAPPEVTPDVNAGAKKAAVVLGAGLLLAVVVIVAALASTADPAPRQQVRPTPVAASAAPVSTTGAPPADRDQALPYTASANCPPGSTSAQALADPAGDSAWVCVRGAPGAAVDGQVLRIEFGRSHVLSAVSATPGWVAKTPGGKDEWLQHRVVTRLQYIFNDVERTVFTQDTGTTHGPVTTPLPKKVLASAATVVVLQTARPVASPLPTRDVPPPDQPGVGDSLLGGDAAPLSPQGSAIAEPVSVGERGGDPVDATFAMSALKFLGHEPN